MKWLLLCGVILMAGDARYGGFDNQQLAAYFGLPVQQIQMLQELFQNKGTQADYGLAQQLAGEKISGSPSGQSNKLNDVLWGLDHLQQHPMGSHYHGFNPTDLIANVATGGLYGAGKAGFNAITGKDDLFDNAKAGLNQLGPWGSSTFDIPKFGPQIAQTGNLIGAGAGIGGGGLNAFKPVGFGTGGAEVAGEAAGAGGPFAITGPLSQPVNTYGGALSLSDPLAAEANPEFGAAIKGSGLSGAAGAPGGSPLSGASFGQTLSQMLGGVAGGAPGMPGAMPIGGAQSPAQGPSQAQLAALGASTPHTGLAPRFEARQSGKQEQPGLADPQELSLAALWGMANH